MVRHLPRRAALGALAVLLTAVTACSSGSAPKPAPTASGSAAPAPSGAPYTLRVLGGSELQDMQPVLDDAQKATGVTVKLSYTGTLDGANTVSAGRADGTYDALWFPSNRYLRLDQAAAGKLLSETPVMDSPVAFGVRSSVLSGLGWDPTKVTWSQIGDAVGQGKLTFGMTDPAQSNSGLSALIGLASAFSGAQAALTDADVAKASPPCAPSSPGRSSPRAPPAGWPRPTSAPRRAAPAPRSARWSTTSRCCWSSTGRCRATAS